MKPLEKKLPFITSVPPVRLAGPSPPLNNASPLMVTGELTPFDSQPFVVSIAAYASASTMVVIETFSVHHAIIIFSPPVAPVPVVKPVAAVIITIIVFISIIAMSVVVLSVIMLIVCYALLIMFVLARTVLNSRIIVLLMLHILILVVVAVTLRIRSMIKQ